MDKQIVEAVLDITFAEPLYKRDIPDFLFERGPNHSTNNIPPEDDSLYPE